MKRNLLSRFYRKFCRRLRRLYLVFGVPHKLYVILPSVLSQDSIEILLTRIERLNSTGCQVLRLIGPPGICNVHRGSDGLFVGEVPQECQKHLTKSEECASENRFANCASCQSRFEEAVYRDFGPQ